VKEIIDEVCNSDIFRDGIWYYRFPFKAIRF
jgi:hypothetical protein